MSNDIYNVDADMDQQSANNTVTSLQRNNIVNNDMNMDDDDMNMDDMSMDDDDMKMDDMEDMDDEDMEDMDDEDMEDMDDEDMEDMDDDDMEDMDDDDMEDMDDDDMEDMDDDDMEDMDDDDMEDMDDDDMEEMDDDDMEDMDDDDMEDMDDDDMEDMDDDDMEDMDDEDMEDMDDEDMEDMDDDDMEDMDDDDMEDMDDDDAENEAGPLTESASLVRLYMGVFDRTPDSEGYKYWAEQMDSGVDLSSIADSFTSSAEFTEKFAGKDDEGFITSLYQNILNREADGAGLDWWTNQLTSGAMDKSDVVLSFTESPEYIANTDSAASNFFASLSGEDDSENMGDDDMEDMGDDDMENMDDEDMENMDDDDMEDMDDDDMENMDDDDMEDMDDDDMEDMDDDDMEDMNDDDMEDMGDDDMDDDDMGDMGANLDSSLVRLYMAVFDRAPDADGFKYWSGEMKQGSDLESIATSFLGSDEFESKYGGQDDESFVNNLYQNVLDRDADSAGLEWWVNELSSEGTDHSDVVLGFSESEEYAQNSEETVNNFLSSLNNSNDTLL